MGRSVGDLSRVVGVAGPLKPRLKPGDRFGKLVVIAKGSAPSTVEVLCDCGNKKVVRTGNLRQGRVNSCGCLRSQLASERIKRRMEGDGKSQE
jgi:hypothetical protein